MKNQITTYPAPLEIIHKIVNAIGNCFVAGEFVGALACGAFALFIVKVCVRILNSSQVTVIGRSQSNI